MIYFNIILSLVCLWVVLWLNHSYFRPALINRHRFKLFALRDDLAIMAMSGKIEEGDKDYTLLMQLINTSIRVMDEFSIVKFLSVMHTITTNQKIQDDIRRFHKNLKEHKNEDLARIAKGYFEISHKVFHSNTRIFRTTLAPLTFAVLFPFYIAVKFIKSGGLEQFVHGFAKKKEEIGEIDSSLDKSLKNFQAVCS